MNNPRYTTLVKGMEARLAFLIQCKDSLLKASKIHKNSKHFTSLFPDRAKRLRDLNQQIKKMKMMMSELDFIRTAWLPSLK